MSTEQKFLDAISDAIAGAPPDWLRALRANIDHKLVSERDFNPAEVEIWATITDVLVNPYPRRLEVFAQQYGINKYRDAVAFVMELANQGGAHKLNKSARMAMLYVMFRCLVDHMSPRIPRTPKTLINMVSHLPHVIERSFPGYLEAGLLHRVVRERAAA